MKVHPEQANGVLVLKPEGRIDGQNAGDFQSSVMAAIADAEGAVVADFGSISYISSAGLRAILLVAKTMRQRNAGFALCSLSEQIDEVFRISGFDKIIAVHGTRADAIAAVAD